MVLKGELDIPRPRPTSRSAVSALETRSPARCSGSAARARASCSASPSRSTAATPPADGTRPHHRLGRRTRSRGRRDPPRRWSRGDRPRTRRRAPPELGTAGVVGDLADQDQTRALADQVNRLGHIDAVIHNAGAGGGADVMAVNVVAPYLLPPSSIARSGWCTSAAACIVAVAPVDGAQVVAGERELASQH